MCADCVHVTLCKCIVVFSSPCVCSLYAYVRSLHACAPGDNPELGSQGNGWGANPFGWDPGSAGMGGDVAGFGLGITVRVALLCADWSSH